MSNSVTSLINTSLSTEKYSASANSAGSVQKEIDALKTQLASDTGMTAEEKREANNQISALQKQLAQAQMSAADSEVSGMVSSIFGSLSSGKDGVNDLSGLSSLLSASATADYTKAVNSARISIENRSRTLTAEIAMDKMRGVDTSAKEKTLANLTENLTMLDGNLSDKIENALKNTEETDSAEKLADKLSEDKKKTESTETDKSADKTDAAEKTDSAAEKTAAEK